MLKAMFLKIALTFLGGGLPTEKVYQRKRFTNGKGLPTEKVYQPLHF